nr:protein kinase-like domain, phloem protein 2-like protein [Tanacetum cinerariifolium]
VELQVLEDQDIVEVASQSLFYTSFEELKQILRIGIHLKDYKTMEDQVLEDDKVEDIQPILDSDSDTYWGQKMPNDCEKILKLSKHSVDGKTKKELYSMLCQGFLIDNGEQTPRTQLRSLLMNQD